MTSERTISPPATKASEPSPYYYARQSEPEEISTSKINLGRLLGFGELRDAVAEFDEKVTLFTFNIEGGKERILYRFFNPPSADGSRTAGGLVETTAVVAADTHLDKGVIVLSDELGDTVISGRCSFFGNVVISNCKISNDCVLYHYVGVYESVLSDGVKLFNRVEVSNSTLSGPINASDEVEITHSTLVCEKSSSLVLTEDAKVICGSNLISTGTSENDGNVNISKVKSEINGAANICKTTLIGEFSICKRGDKEHQTVQINDSILTGKFKLTDRSRVENCIFLGKGIFKDHASAERTNDFSSDIVLSDNQTLKKGVKMSQKAPTFSLSAKSLIRPNDE